MQRLLNNRGQETKGELSTCGYLPQTPSWLLLLICVDKFQDWTMTKRKPVRCRIMRRIRIRRRNRVFCYQIVWNKRLSRGSLRREPAEETFSGAFGLHPGSSDTGTTIDEQGLPCNEGGSV